MELENTKKQSLEKSFYRQDKTINVSPVFKMNHETKTLDVIDYVDDDFERQENKDLSFKESIERFGLGATLSAFDTTGKDAEHVDTTLYSGDINKEWAKAKRCDEQREALNDKIQELELKEQALKQAQKEIKEKEIIENGKE